jgi:hypothetical protein
MGDMSVGRYAYEQYCAASGGKSLISGDTLPAWSALDPRIKGAWEYSAKGVMALLASTTQGARVGELVFANWKTSIESDFPDHKLPEWRSLPRDMQGQWELLARETLLRYGTRAGDENEG